MAPTLHAEHVFWHQQRLLYFREVFSDARYTQSFHLQASLNTFSFAVPIGLMN